jgi:hypothetical protein
LNGGDLKTHANANNTHANVSKTHVNMGADYLVLLHVAYKPALVVDFFVWLDLDGPGLATVSSGEHSEPV